MKTFLRALGGSPNATLNLRNAVEGIGGRWSSLLAQAGDKAKYLSNAIAVWGIVVFHSQAYGGSAALTVDGPPSKKQTEVISWSQLGARAGANYTGEELSVFSAAAANDGIGARLHCVFQRLEGRATTEGLWLVSTVTNQANESLRVKAYSVGRTRAVVLPPTGTVEVADQLARFIRPGLIEEYSVSMDGLRQDFLVLERPPGTGPLELQLSVTGARVEAASGGAHLVLEESGRRIAYSRLRVNDGTGKELAARMEVASHSARSATVMALVVDDSTAAYPIRIDPTFSDANWMSMGGIPGANGPVYAAAVDGSGNLYIGGRFTLVGDALATNIAKWNGSRWSALSWGVNGDVRSLAVSGIDLYAAGAFTTAGGTAANYIAKWNGSSWSAVGSGMNSNVFALAVSGGDVYAGGIFTLAGGTPADRIAKWNGSSWGALGGGIGGSVFALAVSGTDLYAGGYFTTAGGDSAHHVARWDGSRWSALGSGVSTQSSPDPTVYALAVSGSDLYAAGVFTIAGGSPATNIARWNGSSWTAVGSGVGEQQGPIESVSALTVSGTDLYAGGYFTTASGSPARNIAKWDGNSWGALGSGMGPVHALVSAGDLYVGGAFVNGGESGADNIAKWNGSRWSALGSGMSAGSSTPPTVSALVASGSDLYAGGGFSIAGGANNIAAWNGSRWTALSSGINGLVNALALSGSDLYAGGGFTTAGGVPATNTAKWNGSSWSALGSGMNDTVRAIAVSGGDVYAAGSFTTAGGSPANYISKWDGSSWSVLGSGLDGPVAALAVSGSDVYAGGTFATAGGSPAKYVAKWNGSSWSALGSGMPALGVSGSGVTALAASGGDLYAAGTFVTFVEGHPPIMVVTVTIAKWNGSSWSGIDSRFNGSVRTLAVSGTDLYAGGSFTTAGGNAAYYIAKWNGNRWTALGSGMNGSVEALAVSGSDLYAGGEFTIAGGKVSAYVARAVLDDAPGYNQLTGRLSSSGAMQLSYIGYPATNYALDRAFNLTAPITWVGQETNTMTVSGVLMVTNTPAPGTNNFWRVRSVP